MFKLLTLFCTLCTSVCFAQKKITIDFSKGCSFNDQPASKDNIYTFDASTDAQLIINKIVSEIGLKVNFVTLVASIGNACAITEKGVRYIYYDENFMQKINLESNTNWSSVFILAHEIGHHLDGHTLDSLDKNGLRDQYELEADEFGGFILARFGASVSESQSAIQTAVDKEQQTGSYPNKRARLTAVAVGWKKGIAKAKKDTEIMVTPGNAKNENVNKECEANNTGDYSFTNSTPKRVKVFVYLPAPEGILSAEPMIEAPSGGYMSVKWLAGEITIEPGQSETIFNIKAMALVCDIREISTDSYGLPNGFTRKSNILVEKCKSKTYVIK